MDAFSYLSVLLSIIIGLAVTQVLQGYRAILLAGTSVRLDPTTLIWSGVVVLLATQAWWSSFGLRTHSEWSFLSFAVVLLQMIFLYMMAAVILPEIRGPGAPDLATHFLGHRRSFFGFLIGMLGASVAKDIIINGSLPALPNLLFHGFGILAAIVGIAAGTMRVQLGLAVTSVLVISAYVALLFARL